MEPEERDRLTRVETKVDVIEEDVKSLKRDVQSLKRDVQDIKALLAEARGGWRVLVLIGGAGAAAGAFALKIIDRVLP